MKMKTSKYYKYIIYLLATTILVYSCKEERSTTSTPKGGEVIIKTGIFSQIRELKEFEYKGHVYISCDVRDGITFTHAGHCWFNNK